MTAQELREAKRQLDADLCNLVAARVAQFTRETGFSPRSINTRMVTVNFIADKLPTWVTVEVTTDVPIT